MTVGCLQSPDVKKLHILIPKESIKVFKVLDTAKVIHCII